MSNDPQPRAAPSTVELDAIRSRLKAAWPGPWEVDFDRNDQANIYGRTRDYWIAILPHQCVRSIEEEQRRNAEFIASAPSDIETLLAALAARDAEVAALRRENDQLKFEMMRAASSARLVGDQLDAARSLEK